MDPGTVAGLIALAVALGPKLLAHFSIGKAHERKLTLDEIRERTAEHHRLLDVYKADNERLRVALDRAQDHIRAQDQYIDDLEDILRQQNLRIPTPPWHRRRPE